MKKFLATLVVAGLCLVLYNLTEPKAPDVALAADSGARPAQTASATPTEMSATAEATAAPTATAAATDAPAKPRGESSVFVALTPDTAQAEAAASWAQEEMNRIFSESRSDPDSYSYEFNQANDSYRAEDYEDAAELYKNLLSSCPTHPGARNNYALALMQTGDYEEALRQLILLGCLTPEYQGLWANLAVAGYPLGLYPREIWEAVAPLDIGFPDIEEYLAAQTEDSMEEPLYAAYKYNELYLAMERETPPEDARTFDLLVQEMQKGNVVTNEDKERKTKEVWFLAAKEDLNSLAEAGPEDPDVPALIMYLDALRALRYPVWQ